MTQKQFEEIFSTTVKECKSLLIDKSKVYAEHGDRLSNFHDAANYLGCKPSQALLSFLTKHLIALKTKIHSNEIFTTEQFDENIIDIINYMILLRAVLWEENNANTLSPM